jgi:hypothetical protein
LASEFLHRLACWKKTFGGLICFKTGICASPRDRWSNRTMGRGLRVLGAAGFKRATELYDVDV